MSENNDFFHDDRIWARFYRDGKTLREISEEFDCSIFQLSPWLVGPLTDAAFEAIKDKGEALAAKDAEIAKLRSDRNLFKGKYRALLKLVSRTRDKLVHVTDHIEDEGDRRYFGSTNDADELVSLFHTMESWVWDAVDETNRMKSDPYADIREQRARAEKAEGAIEKLADKIEDLIAEFGDDPKAALECVSEHLQLRRQPVQEEV
ncbi:hypothetical protein [Aliirhizobium cellulosilyticum]|uniref:Uncharacterized protein YutE (UPF0331/DUF86 family) n=1 Tax=Aliirhizobium cellulosilyticum TaxID=393664 RepID=A0A7W6UVD8_9HYPH|nr:hypothetical protein [Rhizobium cellulosilyticum]MBB4347990.1 uncharacterized protein YutE (UPF0331/DUF86 family) [Rhizobium cellulosilyticum]MBB4409616.1 uncharacterized protein YutE (UPF0331/DUF86 family) [Rhizobium cellulosilyticum]MBB4444304.1 uncharacterized protein YutE (UPF0331/DUF86 family) [Rhizobium cellulosilyticum]